MRSTPRPAPATLLLAALALPAAAQTGPFADGELLVLNQHATLQDTVLYRIDPTDGDGEPFVGGFFSASGPDWLEYDAWRDGVLFFAQRVPQAFVPRLHLARADGQVVQLGFEASDLAGLAPAGDGRVYLTRAGVLSVLLPTNAIVPVLDAATGQPVPVDARHLAYDAARNAIVGAQPGWVAGPCVDPFGTTAVRLDLSADGMQVVASSCQASAIGGGVSVCGIDPLPGGDYLVTLSDGGLPDDQLLRLDPDTLALTFWSVSHWNALTGGVWSQALGLAVVMDNGFDALHTYAAGQTSVGGDLATDVLASDGVSGHGNLNRIADVELSGPACAGSATPYGAGLAGYNGTVPQLGAGTCPQTGTTLVLRVWDGVGSGAGLVAVGAAPTALPLLGGTLYVAPPLLASKPIALDSHASQGGYGDGQVLLAIPDDPAFVGLHAYCQAGILDAHAPQAVSLTAGLELVIG